MANSKDTLQFAYKKIRLRKQHPTEAKKISAEFKLSPLASRILAARGYKADDNLANYLDPTLKGGLATPKDLLNLDKACLLIRDTLRAQQAIAICCDFDVDGLTGGAQVQHFFKSIGVSSKVFVPNRFEDGYGLNEKMIREIAEKKYSLVIAIDYGTTNIKELKLAKELGLKTIVVDHHHVGDSKPPCDVFINPMQKGCGFAEGILCASGLAWYLILGMKSHLEDILPVVKGVDARQYLDLACLGTICDMVPLTGVNRVLARRGLELLSWTKRAGLVAIKKAMGLNSNVGCYEVSFGIGPRINAAGRMENAEMVVDLLTTDDTEKAQKIAKTLHELNVERQETEQEVKQMAIGQIQSRYSAKGLPWGIVVSDESFHTGVIGIVAQRLVECYYRPTVVFGVDSEGIYKGSARGIKGFSVVEAFADCAEHLIKYGGHEGAGGCTLEADKLVDFVSAFEESCRNRLEGLETSPFADADTEASLSEVSVELVNELKLFAPFGMGNPNPIVLTKNLKVENVRDIKATHLKATLTDGKSRIAGMLWRQTTHPHLVKDSLVSIAYKPDYSNFNGLTEIQANLQAVEGGRK